MILTMEQMAELVNQVPSGFGIYGIRDGMPYELFLNDGYYKLLGVTREERPEFHGELVVNSVHPDDRAALAQAIREAYGKDGALRIVLRIKRHEVNDYCWLQLDGRWLDRTADGGTILVSFSDIDGLMRAGHELEKSKMTLETSLAAGNQMCCEYDPVLHTLTGKTGKSVLFGLENELTDFPHSVFHVGLFHPDDEAYLEEKMAELSRPDGTEEQSHFEARIRYCGNLRWFAFNFKRFFDREKQYDVFICNFMDITLQKEALQAYQNHLDSIMQMNPEAFATARMNLTRNRCGEVSSRYKNVQNLNQQGTVSGFFQSARKLISSKTDRDDYGRIFHVPAMLEAFHKGIRRFCHQHRFELQDGHSEWIETVVDLIENPENGEIEGILYANNINTKKIEAMVLQETLQKDYLQIAVFFSDQEEYYLFDPSRNEHCVCHQNFWQSGIQAVVTLADESEREWLRKMLSENHVRAALKKHQQYTVTFQRTTPRLRRYEIQYTRMGGEAMMLGTLRDITDGALQEKLKYDSEHDALTGLYNREMTFRQCDHMLERHPEENFAVARFDIQRFRLYNSFYGEKEGDRLLIYIAEMIREFASTCPYSVFGRVEADVFLLCYPYEEATVLDNERFIGDYLKKYRDDFYITGSCGIYLTSMGRLPAEAMFNRAGIAVKNNRNRQSSHVVYYDQHENDELLREQRIIKEMQPALKEKQFVVYLQPKYRVSDEKPMGAEALVRWIHPKHGIVPPDAFIPIFEKNGFITELDKYMWEQVCIMMRDWIDAGYRVDPISVNVSRVSMYSPLTVPYLTRLVKQYDLDPKLLNLELTESTYMDAPDVMKERVLELQSLGFQIMMDDFGSAYSSLNTLRELPVDFLKVDRLFLASIEQNQRSRIVLSSVVQMANALKVPVVMEGVESEEHREFVAEIGCDYIQGYYYARPMPAEEYAARILEKS